MTLATYLFFVFTVIGRQKIDGYGLSSGDTKDRMTSGRLPTDLDIYLPVYTILQFFFYMGLLKVSLSNKKKRENVSTRLQKDQARIYIMEK